jgi:tetratricopeptide (TPR) repeat protein
MYTQAAKDQEDRSGMDRDRRALLERAARFYEEVALPQSRDPEVRHEAAQARYRLGEILFMFGRRREAEAAYKRALEVLEPLVAEHPRPPGYRQTLAATHNSLGSYIYLYAGRFREAEAAYKRALVLRERLVAQHPDVADFRLGLGKVYNNLASIYEERRQPEQAAEARQKSLDIMERLVAKHPDVAEYLDALTAPLNMLASSLEKKGQWAEAQALLERTLAIYRGLCDRHPHSGDYRRRLSEAALSLGKLFLKTHRASAAEEPSRKARAICLELVAAHPDIRKYRIALAEAHRFRADFLLAVNRTEEAVAEFKLIISAVEGGAVHDLDLNDREMLAPALLKLGDLTLAAGRRAEAEKAYRRGVDIIRQLAVDFPAKAVYSDYLALGLVSLAQIYESDRRVSEAIAAYREAVSVRERMIARDPKSAGPGARTQLGDSLRWFALALFDAGRLDQCEEAYRRALRVDEALAAEFPTDGRFSINLARNSFSLGKLREVRKDFPGALDWYGHASRTLLGVDKHHLVP